MTPDVDNGSPHQAVAHVRTTAPVYDRFTADSLAPWDRLLIGRLLSERRLKAPGGTLLEIGAGTGVLAVKLAALDSLSDVAMVVTDLFEDMLAVARTRIAEARLPDRIALQVQDAHDLMIETGVIRYVLSRSTLHHWHTPVRALSEIGRVLEPGGVAIIHDVRRDAPAFLIDRLNKARRRAGLTTMDMDEKYVPAEVEGLCRQAGLGGRFRVSHLTGGAAALGFELRIQG